MATSAVVRVARAEDGPRVSSETLDSARWVSSTRRSAGATASSSACFQPGRKDLPARASHRLRESATASVCGGANSGRPYPLRTAAAT
ncbi:hypothetical protein D3C74_469440 [compost metagenome]